MSGSGVHQGSGLCAIGCTGFGIGIEGCMRKKVLFCVGNAESGG
jgi:hypothetical protein